MVLYCRRVCLVILASLLRSVEEPPILKYDAHSGWKDVSFERVNSGLQVPPRFTKSPYLSNWALGMNLYFLTTGGTEYKNKTRFSFLKTKHIQWENPQVYKKSRSQEHTTILEYRNSLIEEKVAIFA